VLRVFGEIYQANPCLNVPDEERAIPPARGQQRRVVRDCQRSRVHCMPASVGAQNVQGLLAEASARGISISNHHARAVGGVCNRYQEASLIAR
jgi:hypothetical protein